MKAVSEKYPNDLDAKALYAYALFDVLEWEFWDKKAKIIPETRLLINTLKSILAKDKTQIGAHHYFIHVMEQSPKPSDALESARFFRTGALGLDHLTHMPSHIYLRTGRYHEGSEVNLQAILADQQYVKICRAQGFSPEINYLYFHNYDFLRYTATMEGRSRLALDAARKIVGSPLPVWIKNDPTLQWFIPMPYYVEARFGMWKSLLKEPMPKVKYLYALGMWHYAEGLALAHIGHVKAAEKEVAKLHRIIKKLGINPLFGRSSFHLLGIAEAILAATIADRHGNEADALYFLQKALKIQHDMGYREPPDWYFPVEEALGDLYLKWQHPLDAKKMYETDLKQHPQNGWALYGLAESLRALGEESKRRQVLQAFKKAWQYADIPKPYRLFDNP